jgi:hypothetical protein
VKSERTREPVLMDALDEGVKVHYGALGLVVTEQRQTQREAVGEVFDAVVGKLRESSDGRAFLAALALASDQGGERHADD